MLSFGNRTQIEKKAEELHDTMGASPYQYVMSKYWEIDFPKSNAFSYYRMVSYSQMNSYFRRLYDAYVQYDSLEDALSQFVGSPMTRLCNFMEVPANNPQKTINMFLRWMIRRNSPVDFGIWKSFAPSELIIPLDTHVCRMANYFYLTKSKSFTLKNACFITAELNEIFPGDPCLGDFALFGLGVNKQY